MGEFGDLTHGHYRTERVRHLRDRHELGPGVEELLILVEENLSAVVHGDHPQARTLLTSELLPGDDVGVMLQVRNDDFVTGENILPAPGLCHEIDGFGSAAHEYDLFGPARAQESLHGGASAL